MANFDKIIRDLSEDDFSNIFAASSRQARETCFSRHAIKLPKKATKFNKPGEKNKMRTSALYQILQTKNDDEMIEEILRCWLLTKRSMLIKALDYLKIEHTNGLTDSDDISKFESLSAKEITNLTEELKEVASLNEIHIYLKFMGTKRLLK